MISNTRYSIREISKLKNSKDETLLFCQFLDDFYSTKSNCEKYKLIEDEPFFDETNKEFMCMLASAVHKLANDYGLMKPKWIYDDKYILSEECYAFHTKNIEYQKFLKSTTPYEYKSRNLLYGEDVIKRC